MSLLRLVASLADQRLILSSTSAHSKRIEASSDFSSETSWLRWPTSSRSVGSVAVAGALGARRKGLRTFQLSTEFQVSQYAAFGIPTNSLGIDGATRAARRRGASKLGNLLEGGAQSAPAF